MWEKDGAFMVSISTLLLIIQAKGISKLVIHEIYPTKISKRRK